MVLQVLRQTASGALEGAAVMLAGLSRSGASELGRCTAFGLRLATNQFAQHRHRSHLAYEELTAGSPTPQHPTASPSRTLFILHGLLGSGRNWRTWARKLVEGAAAAHPPEGGPWRVVMVDLRCHGESTRRPGFHPPHTMRSAAEDVSELIRQQLGSHAPGAVLGHSLGGKVALALLEGAAAAAAAAAAQPGQQGQQQPHHPHPGPAGGWCALPRQLWVLDSQPGKVPAELDAGTGVSRVLKEVQSVPMPIPSRAWLLSHLRSRGLSEAICAWLASGTTQAQPWAAAQHAAQHGSSHHSQQQQQQQQHGGHHAASLHSHTQPAQQAHGHKAGHAAGHGGTGGASAAAAQQLVWAFDSQGAGAMYMSYRMTEFWNVLEHPPPGTAVHLVQGAKSDRWPQELQQRLLAAAAASDAAAQAAAAAGEASSRGTFERHSLEAAGHWVHVDNPAGLLRMVIPRLTGL